MMEEERKYEHGMKCFGTGECQDVPMCRGCPYYKQRVKKLAERVELNKFG